MGNPGCATVLSFVILKLYHYRGTELPNFMGTIGRCLNVSGMTEKLSSDIGHFRDKCIKV